MSGFETGAVEAGIAVAEVAGATAGAQVVVDRRACCVGRGSDIVAVVLPLAFAVFAAIAAELTRTDCILVGSGTVVVDAGAGAAIVADIAAVAAGKDIAGYVAVDVVVAADASVDFGLPGNSDIAAQTASDTAYSAAAAVGMAALAAALLRLGSFARVDIWMLE